MSGICLTHHAIQRYHKRWAPDQSLDQVREELESLILEARPENKTTMAGQQLWSTTRRESREKVYFVVKRDQRKRHKPFVCVTVLPNGTLGSNQDLVDEDFLAERAFEEQALANLRARIDQERLDAEALQSRKEKYKSEKGLFAVFLDFDGVLNNHTFLLRERQLPPDMRLDEVNVKRVSEISMMSKVTMIVTSSWRHGKTLDDLHGILQRRRYRGPLGGMTPISHPEQTRWQEIQIWLDEQERIYNKISSFVILDDETDFGPLTPHLLRVDPLVGLTEENVREVQRRIKFWRADHKKQSLV